MKKILALLTGVFLLLAFIKNPITSPNKKDVSFVEDLLSKMSIEEKVGQMTQINISILQKKDRKPGELPLDEEKLKNALINNNVGSVLNAMVGKISMKDWHLVINQIAKISKQTPNKIPVLYGVDAIHGATYIENGTLFPHNIGMAASRNKAMAKTVAQITAAETRASGVRWNFDPVFDIGRNPIWPRFPETFGEDPYLIGELGTEMIKGYEGDDLSKPTNVASCMKHFVGYSGARTGWDRTPALIPERELREYYLPQFQKAIDAGSSTIMINSAEINGIPTHANKYLLTDVLRGEMGFKGLVVTDWEDVIYLHSKHKIAATLKDAVEIAVNAGIDMSMTPMDFDFYTLLLELVKEGKISETRINESVRRILKIKFDLGLFDNSKVEKEAQSGYNKPEYAKAALDAARESMTLLKNDNNILPLDKSKKVLLVGPAANNKSSLNGCWSYSWQGDDESLFPESILTIKQAFENKIGADNVICQSVSDYEADKNYNVDFVSKNSEPADVIVLCLGENAYAETPGSIKDLTLDARQLKLATAAIATGKPVVMLLVEGRPRIISSIEPGISGIIQAYWPSSQGANALADVVFGDYNPSGRLPYTYPRHTGHQVLYDHKFSELGADQTQGGYTYNGYHPQWPFGFGLSYSTVDYSEISLDKESMTIGDELTVTITLKNTSAKDVVEIVDLFTRDHYASITPPQRRLRRFQRVALKAGETKAVNFTISTDDLKFVGLDMKWIVEPGKFDIYIGDKSKTFEIK